MTKKSVFPSKKTITVGNDIAAHLCDASVQKALGNNKLGGCKPFDLHNFPEKYQDLIAAYINNEIDSITAIYIAMERSEKKK